MTKVEIFENLDDIDILNFFYLNRDILRLSKILNKKDPAILANVNQNGYIPKIISKIEIFKHFDQNERFFKLLSKIEVLGNFD